GEESAQSALAEDPQHDRAGGRSEKTLLVERPAHRVGEHRRAEGLRHRAPHADGQRRAVAELAHLDAAESRQPPGGARRAECGATSTAAPARSGVRMRAAGGTRHPMTRTPAAPPAITVGFRSMKSP